MTQNGANYEMHLEGIKLLYNVSLRQYTYTKTGGLAEIMALPKTHDEVATLLKYCRNQYVKWVVLGEGSNLIVKDGGFRGVVITLSEMQDISIQEGHITADAGAKLIDVSYKALENNLTGLEFACGIPGTVGGAVFMNAGAYGGEVKDILINATILDSNGKIRTISNQDLRFSYRKSVLQEMSCIILRATFCLQKGNFSTIKMKMNELTWLRKSKQPLEYPSCGSVFKRPCGYFAGKLIQDAGLQGRRSGGAQVSEKHAGFIVNLNEATATDYVELINYIKEKVKDQFGVMLENEVRIIGEDN